MKRGKAATVIKGPYEGDQLSVDHIIPRAVVPELDNVIANLELMSLRMNESKNAKVDERQLVHVLKGLLVLFQLLLNVAAPAFEPGKNRHLTGEILRCRFMT